MYSIPHKQFAISQGVPLKKFPQINGLQRGWKRYHPVLDKKGGGGVYFLWLNKAKSYLKAYPLRNCVKRGGGYIYDRT